MKKSDNFLSDFLFL